MFEQDEVAAEWGERGVRVNAVAPTYIDTPLNAFVKSKPEMWNAWIGGTPMARLGKVEEIASVVLLLASDAASLMTGSIVLADGGYTCVLLDLGLPKQDGTALLRHARERGDRTPVVVLSARDSLGERVQGLDLGADDYLPKPFELPELLARMRAVVRRRDGAAHSLVGTGALQLDLTTREVLVDVRREVAASSGFGGIPFSAHRF